MSLTDHEMVIRFTMLSAFNILNHPFKSIHLDHPILILYIIILLNPPIYFHSAFLNPTIQFGNSYNDNHLVNQSKNCASFPPKQTDDFCMNSLIFAEVR